MPSIYIPPKMVLNPKNEVILNPHTNRYINVGTRKHKRLIREGVLKDPAKEPEQEKPVEEEVEEKPAEDKVSALIEVAGDNYKKLSKTKSDSDLQSMLRKLLNAKLDPGKKKSKNVKPKKKVKKKKSKYKSRKVESSSSESSSSSSESDSD